MSANTRELPPERAPRPYKQTRGHAHTRRQSKKSNFSRTRTPRLLTPENRITSERRSYHLRALHIVVGETSPALATAFDPVLFLKPYVC